MGRYSDVKDGKQRRKLAPKQEEAILAPMTNQNRPTLARYLQQWHRLPRLVLFQKTLSRASMIALLRQPTKAVPAN